MHCVTLLYTRAHLILADTHKAQTSEGTVSHLLYAYTRAPTRAHVDFLGNVTLDCMSNGKRGDHCTYGYRHLFVFISVFSSLFVLSGARI